MKLNKFEPTRDIQRILKKSVFNTQLDFEIFSIENYVLGAKNNSSGIPVGGDRIGYKEFCKYFKMFTKGEINIDDDNSNTYYVPDEDLTIVKNKTPRGFFYNFYITFLGKAINIFTVEVFSGKAKFTNEVGRFIFRGAFYYFIDFIPTYVYEIYYNIKGNWEKNRLKPKSIIKRTRVDVAYDLNCPVFNYAKYTNVSTTSKTAVKAYNPNKDGLYTSFGYLPIKSNKGYGFRIYDKIKDTKDKNKGFWYGDIIKELENWQRIEYQLHPPYSHQCSDDELFSGLSSVLFGTPSIDKKIIWKPKSDYNSQNSLKNFNRYAKNHGVVLGNAILDLTDEYFKSSEVSVFEKLDTFAISLKKMQENNTFNQILLAHNLTDDQLLLIEKYFETPNGKILKDFATNIIKNGDNLNGE